MDEITPASPVSSRCPTILPFAGGGLRPPVAPGTRRPVSFAPRQTLVSSYKSQTAHSTASG
ncbi:hypothetical protein P4593_28290, partial [Priestia megaterium]|uniref:hypothetical protein n=1 Tax=Priestia megaterium TaxID=1404 RepID=UPI0030C9FB2B